MSLLINDIIISLESFQEQKRIDFAKRTYPTSMQVIGVTNPNSKEVLKELKIQTKSFKPREKIELAKSLIDTNIFECQYIAYEWIGKDKKCLKEFDVNDLKAFGKNLDNWVSVDSYGAYFLGYLWREGLLTTDTIKGYSKHKDFWQRRLGLVATLSFNQKARGGKGNSKLTLEICRLYVDDHHNMINKALSWALRELAKIDAAPVRDFLDKYASQLHKKVLREVSNKLQLGYKN